MTASELAHKHITKNNMWWIFVNEGGNVESSQTGWTVDPLQFLLDAVAIAEARPGDIVVLGRKD